MVNRRITRLIGYGRETDDVILEVFIQVYRSLGSFRQGEPFEPWLIGVTTNVARTHLRKRARTLDLAALLNFSVAADGWARLAARAKVRILHAALDQVADEAREAFVLHTLEGLTLAEIAENTGVSINTIAARVRRTRARLKGILDRVENASKPMKSAAG